MKINSERLLERLYSRHEIAKEMDGPIGEGYRLAIIQIIDVVKQEEAFAKELEELENLKAQLEKEGKI